MTSLQGQMIPFMSQFRSAHAAAESWRDAVASCIRELESKPAGSNLGFVYVTDAFADDLDAIVTMLRERTGVADWVGTVGIGICANGIEYHSLPAISVLVGEVPGDGFRIFGTVRGNLGSFEQANAGWIEKTGSRFAIVHGDPRNSKVPALIERLAEEINDGFVVGGLTSSRGAYAQVAGGVTEGGLSGVLFAPEVAVATTLTQGCAPFGAMHEVTECERNVLIELDGKPALDVFFDEIGEELARDIERAANFIGAALPVAGSDRRDFLVRNLVGADRDRKLLAIGERVEKGRQVQFCRRDPESAERDLRTMLGELKERLPGAPGGAVYYSCLGRGAHMFGPESRELKIIREELGNIPLAGFFCNGEISHNRLYGYTGVLTVFL